MKNNMNFKVMISLLLFFAESRLFSMDSNESFEKNQINKNADNHEDFKIDDLIKAEKVDNDEDFKIGNAISDENFAALMSRVDSGIGEDAAYAKFRSNKINKGNSNKSNKNFEDDLNTNKLVSISSSSNSSSSKNHFLTGLLKCANIAKKFYSKDLIPEDVKTVIKNIESHENKMISKEYLKQVGLSKELEEFLINKGMRLGYRVNELNEKGPTKSITFYNINKK